MSPRTGWTLLPLTLLVLAPLGCSGGGSAKPDAAGAAGTGAAGTGAAGTGSVDPNAVVGGFSVNLLAEQMPPASQVTGFVKEGPANEAVVWESMAQMGGCTLLKPRIPFCSPTCTLGNTCVDGDTCKKDPASIDVGAVTLEGLKVAAGGTSVALMNVNNSYGSGTSLSFPPFDEGAGVSVSATGGSGAAFTIQAKGIAPLVAPAGTLPIDRNKDLALTWTAKGAASDATIHIKVDISHHGGTKGKIECDAMDTGSLTIAAALMTSLINLGVSGYPSVSITRTSIGTATTSRGRIRLTLDAPVERFLTLPGLTSCTGDTDCPMGQKCQQDLQCK